MSYSGMSMPTGAMIKSSLLTAALAAGSFKFVGSPLAGMSGGGEYGAVFVGLGIAAVVSPILLGYLEKAMDASAPSPAMPSLDKAALMSFIYGGAIGTGVYWGINQIYPGLDDIYDVGLSAIAAGALGPYLALPQF